ncbi:thioesterase domain-containing protein [Pseudomonas sp. LS1212]|uniref:thioesterase II family protein n=1 Tax=Pseudomonas sp. LS1212 TaxID=2972478 RepID=UPI00215C7F1C|nr:alpha/beta fold hydrolase [Pseudomonas sp. LS1212]UVJ44148.1 thioesterase domain-containing protein [Pseudomonas sp. LS1212]
MHAHDNKWLTVVNSGQPAKIRLVCFPYAGGDSENFRSWSQDLGDHIELVTVKLPGHGSRLNEPPYAEWTPLLQDTFTLLSRYLSEPHALFGHNLGGQLAYEIAKLCEVRYPGQTRHLFVSACRSPDSQHPRPFLHELPQPEFDKAFRDLGLALPEAENVLQTLEPTLRCDLKLTELWSDRLGERLNVPLTALYGSDDPHNTVASMMNWREFTRREFELIEINGGR